MGNPFKWNLLNLSLGGNLVFKDGGIKGVKTTTRNGSLIIEITDLLEAYEYFQKHSGNLTFVGEFPGTGTLENESSKNQHWFKVGMGVSMSGPKSLEDMNSVKAPLVPLFRQFTDNPLYGCRGELNHSSCAYAYSSTDSIRN